MPEYLSPGVYVEEVDAGPRPIAGVSTSTAGMVGVTQRGPVGGKPKLVTNFLEYQTTFGGFLPEPDPAIRDAWAANPGEGGRWWQFPLAVKGFFDNGGQRLYVKRVFSGSALASSGTLGHGMVSEVEQDAAATATSIKLRHLFNLDEGATFSLIRGDTGVAFANGPFTVTSYDAGTRMVGLSPTSGTGIGLPLNVARGDKAVIQPLLVAAGDATLGFSAKARGA